MSISFLFTNCGKPTFRIWPVLSKISFIKEKLIKPLPQTIEKWFCWCLNLSCLLQSGIIHRQIGHYYQGNSQKFCYCSKAQRQRFKKLKNTIFNEWKGQKQNSHYNFEKLNYFQIGMRLKALFTEWKHSRLPSEWSKQA